MSIKFARTVACLTTATLTTLGLAACGAGDPQPGAAGTPGPDTVATTQVWADVARTVLGREVGAVISNPSTDPHDYEPTAEDRARVSAAGLVIANGGAYDAALYSAADPAKVVSALPLVEPHEHGHGHAHGTGGHDHGADDHDHDTNEHVWYSTTTLAKVGHAIADSSGGTTDALDTRLSEIASALAALPSTRVAQVHPIADSIIDESPLDDVTPAAYRQASLDEIEPSGAAVAEVLEALGSGEVDLLISDPQSPNGAAQRIVVEAKAKGVPVVEINETPPSGEDFLDYFLRITRELAQARQ